MLQKKYQIFVSSTFADLRRQRSLVIEAIVSMGHIPAGMELFRSGRETWETIKPWILSSDYPVFVISDTTKLGTKLGDGDDGAKIQVALLACGLALRI